MWCVEIAMGHSGGGRPLDADQLAGLELHRHPREHGACDRNGIR